MRTGTHEVLECRRDGTRGLREPGRHHDAPIDWMHLSRFTLNDKALEHEVLGLFAMEAPRYLARMYAAADRKDWIEAAHTLKGSARAVGAWAIAECAQAAETLEINAGPEAIRVPAQSALRPCRGMIEALEKLNEAVRRTLIYIEQMRSATTPEALSHRA